jgi:hypothetical protein
MRSIAIAAPRGHWQVLGRVNILPAAPVPPVYRRAQKKRVLARRDKNPQVWLPEVDRLAPIDPETHSRSVNIGQAAAAP